MPLVPVMLDAGAFTVLWLVMKARVDVASFNKFSFSLKQ